MRKILTAFLLMGMVLGAFPAWPDTAPSPAPTKRHGKTQKRSIHKKTKAKKPKKKARKSKARGKGPQEADSSELGSEIDHKAVTIDLQGK